MGLFNTIFPVILQGAQFIADSLVDGSKLSSDVKQTLYSAYVLIKVHGEEIVANSNNTYDDEALSKLAVFCEDTLDEAGVSVPEIPPKLFEEPRP